MAAQGVHKLPAVNGSRDLKEALQKLASIPASRTLVRINLYNPKPMSHLDSVFLPCLNQIDFHAGCWGFVDSPKRKWHIVGARIAWRLPTLAASVIVICFLTGFQEEVWPKTAFRIWSRLGTLYIARFCQVDYNVSFCKPTWKECSLWIETYVLLII